MADYDVIVIGGGPAGSTAAALLAREGRKVAVFDRDRWPRYHIGESLLPGVLPFLEELGVAEEMKARGFHLKTGQTFRWGPDRTPWQLDFKQLDVYPYAYFVERAEFDDVLLKNAERLGAKVHEGSTVEEILFSDGRASGVRVRIDGAAATDVTARYIVDASGQNALLAHRNGTRRWIKGLRNLAVWSYWEGVAPLPAPQDDHIVTISIPTGWVWLLPMKHGRFSVGVVTHDWTNLKTENSTDAAGDIERWYEKTVGEADTVGEMLRPARRVEKTRVQRDWSYCVDRFNGPGYCLAGDAACFIDPILSTGVQLAMTGGYLSALALNSALAEPRKEAAFLHYHQQAYGQSFREQLTQVRYFYRTEAHRDSIFWKSKRLLRVNPQLDGSLAFLFMNSGLARHVTSARPHDTAGQARTLFSSLRDANVETVPYRKESIQRQLAPPGFITSSEKTGRRSFGISQRGMRLELTPTRPTRWAQRSAGAAALFEIDDKVSGNPIGTLIVEPGPSDRLTCETRTYRGCESFAPLLSDASGAVLSLARPGDESDVPAFEERVVRELADEPARSWRVSELPPIDSLALVEHPISVEYRRTQDGVSIWVVVQTRRDPHIDDVPFLRTRFVDMSYAGMEASNPEAMRLLSWAVDQVRTVVRRAETISAALDACQDSFAGGTDIPTGWELVTVRRMAPNRWADEEPGEEGAESAP